MYEIRFHGRGGQGTVIGSKSLIKDFLLMRQIDILLKLLIILRLHFISAI